MLSSLRTPILLLIFNRPETTARVFEEIRNAKPSRLFVAGDGPRSSVRGDAELCNAARKVATAVDWDCTVRTLFRHQNLGCKNAVNGALDWFFLHEDEGIILEDDCLPSGSFFGFAQELLARYRDDERVAMITGTNYLGNNLQIDDSYFFSRYFTVWGWATWKRVWERHDKAMSSWATFRSEGRLPTYYRQAFMERHVRTTYDLAWRGEIDTWDIQFSFSCLKSNALAAVPRVNLVSNIGLAGTHTTSDSRNHDLPRYALELTRLAHPLIVAPEPRYDEVFFRREFGRHPLRSAVRAMWGAWRKAGRIIGGEWNRS